MGWLSFLCPLPRIIRVIGEGEYAPRAFVSIPRTPAVCLPLGGPDDASVMGCISAVVRRIITVGRTLGIHAE